MINGPQGKPESKSGGTKNKDALGRVCTAPEADLPTRRTSTGTF